MANPLSDEGKLWRLAHYPNDARPCTMVYNSVTDEVDSVWYECEWDDHIDKACTRQEELNEAVDSR